MKRLIAFILIYVFLVHIKKNEDKNICLNKLYSIPDVISVEICESDSLHFFGSYYDAKIILENEDCFYIGDMKSDLSFDDTTKLYHINKTELFYDTGNAYSFCIPVWILSEAYGKQIDDFYIFHSNYLKIAEFLNDDFISTKKIKTRKGEFTIGRYNDKKISAIN